MVLFDKRVDPFLVPILSAALVFIFYGLAAAAISLMFMISSCHLHLAKATIPDAAKRWMLAAGAMLTAAYIFRFIFTESFCLTAPLSLMGNEVSVADDSLQSLRDSRYGQNPVFVALASNEIGKLGELAARTCRDALWPTSAPYGWGFVRDIAMPFAGALLLIGGVRQSPFVTETSTFSDQGAAEEEPGTMIEYDGGSLFGRLAIGLVIGIVLVLGSYFAFESYRLSSRTTLKPTSQLAPLAPLTTRPNAVGSTADKGEIDKATTPLDSGPEKISQSWLVGTWGPAEYNPRNDHESWCETDAIVTFYRDGTYRDGGSTGDFAVTSDTVKYFNRESRDAAADGTIPEPMDDETSNLRVIDHNTFSEGGRLWRRCGE